MLRKWVLDKLERVKDSSRIIIQDPLGMFPEAEECIHTFARDNEFSVIIAATNLVFRELYEQARSDPGIKKLLLVDRTPARRKSPTSTMKAPPLFYPDLLAETPKDARIDLNLRQFLIETTSDPLWHQESNNPRYARLILRHLSGVLRAHQNLRTNDAERFTDHDFQTIVAFASLGIPELAFKILEAQDYWKVGLSGHENLPELESLAPEVTVPIKQAFRQAPMPFCGFADHDPETVIRAFYLAVLLSQHTEQWGLLLGNIDPALSPLTNIDPQILENTAPQLVALDPLQANRDLEVVERSLSSKDLQLVLIDQLKITSPEGLTKVLEKEHYSNLIRSSTSLLALENLLSSQSIKPDQQKIYQLIFPEAEVSPRFVDQRPSLSWSQLKEAYGLAYQIQSLREELNSAIKQIKVMPAEDLSIQYFLDVWNGKKLNRLEYYLSALERLLQSGDLLPRPLNDLPPIFGQALDQMKSRLRTIIEEVNRQLDELNVRFQELVVSHYTSWVAEKSEVRLTSQFLHRCLKPYWDPLHEKAAVFIFDGMRYDIWDGFLRPLLEENLDLIADLPALSLLPSETHITRKAISAGTFPDEFNTKFGEDRLLKDGLARVFNYQEDVVVVPPEGGGIGETVRYRAGNLDIYIFELCDKELHKIHLKTLPDGRVSPSRPLSFVYQQHLKNILDTEVMAIIRSLPPNTKVFITADHGFGKVHREVLKIDASWLNIPGDCSYLNAKLRHCLTDVNAPAKIKDHVWEIPVADLRLPAQEAEFDPASKQSWQKQYRTVIFPKTGYVLSRPGASFKPDAYSHGGISLQELLIPMVVLKVRAKEQGLLKMDNIQGPPEVLEGNEAEFRLALSRRLMPGDKEEIRMEVEASYCRDVDLHLLTPQVLYLADQPKEVIFRFSPNSGDATSEDRRQGEMQRTLTITVTYREGHRTIKQSRTHIFTVRLNPEQVVRRVPTHLGKILGLTPKSGK